MSTTTRAQRQDCEAALRASTTTGVVSDALIVAVMTAGGVVPPRPTMPRPGWMIKARLTRSGLRVTEMAVHYEGDGPGDAA